MVAHHTGVQTLSNAQWAERLQAAAQPVPFGRAPWIAVGLIDSPQLRFTPVQIDGPGDGPLLIPLCRNGDEAQIGAYGYGMVYPAAGRPAGQPLPFSALAAALGDTLGLREIHTLLPPPLPGLPTWLDTWPSSPGRDTYLLDLSAGPDAVWAAAKGRMRTAVRRAQTWGLSVTVATIADAEAIDTLHAVTMARHDITRGERAEQLRALLAQHDDAVLAVLARSGRGVEAASVFAVGGRLAYHVMQLTSDDGRRTNAGYLSFFSALGALTARGVQLADLGAAGNDGQARFKTDWGATAHATRRVAWRKGESA
ncbi:GNAT family N-acetyltransferase [Mycobacterium branderi]|nr:GNAT family N-acetyltransferase [Mycobacterium branderi]MCV7236394.1 GNAT family N-acetyltransferase [Mycobacterium branderi]BBZ15281.1 hypothetical protein MBRA_54760 [Mycobacterium branderi]